MEPMDRTLSRRGALVAAGGVGVIATLGSRLVLDPAVAGAADCTVLQREVTEGPYYLDTDLIRRDITGGRTGTPLTLRFRVLDVSTCKPIKGATVELWHADAAGQYSGVQGVSGNWLRGGQRTGTEGWVRFDSIFPGWYSGRTPHIHMKVFVSGDEVHTGQVFFRSSVEQLVYAQGAYAERGQADVVNASDAIYRQAGKRALMSLRRKGTRVSQGLAGRMAIGVNPSA